jgi:hypothetical protein
MVRRITAVILTVTLLNIIIGCTSVAKVPANEVEVTRDGKIEKVVLKSGEIIEFDEDGGRINKDKQTVAGYINDEAHYGTLFEYKFDDIENVQYRSLSASHSFITAGGALAVLLIAWQIAFGDFE